VSNYQRSITVPVTAPSPVGNCAGFYLTITPNYSASAVARLDGSTLLDGSASTGGATAPMVLGPYSYTDFPTGVTVMIPEPSEHPLTYQAVVQSYNAAGIVNPMASSPSATFTLALPAGKPASGTAFTSNASGLGVGTAVQSTSGGVGAGTGTSYTFLPVTWTIPTDAKYQGTIFVIVGPSGAIWWESDPETGTSATLAFPTPTAVGTYTVYACGYDGTNVNPVVSGITPSFTISIGTNGGVVDATQIPTGSGVTSAGGVMAVAYGAGLKDNGSGLATLNVAPSFSTVSGALALAAAAAGGGLTLTGNTLSANVASVAANSGLNLSGGVLSAVVDGTTISFNGSGGLQINGVPLSTLPSIPLSKLGGGSGSLPAGWTYAGNIGVSQIAVAGNAYFAGTAVFAYDAAHPYLEIGAAGVILGDNFTSPLNMVAISSLGLSLATYNSSYTTWSSGTYAKYALVSYQGLNYISLQAGNTTTPGTSGAAGWWAVLGLSVTSAGVGIYGPAGSFVATSAGVTITSIGGSNGGSVTISGSGGVLIQNTAGTSYVQANSSGVLVVGGTLTAPTINGGSISGATAVLNSNGIITTINNATSSVLGLACGLTVYDGTNTHGFTSLGHGSYNSGGVYSFLLQVYASKYLKNMATLLLGNFTAGASLELVPVTATSASTTSGGPSLPANPAQFLECYYGGTQYKIPLYAT
jgi:hypothetical protein